MNATQFVRQIDSMTAGDKSFAECIVCHAPKDGYGLFVPGAAIEREIGTHEGRRIGIGYAFCEDCRSRPWFEGVVEKIIVARWKARRHLATQFSVRA